MYQKLLKWCKDSEIILFARLQYLGGLAIGLLSVVSPGDLSVLGVSPKGLAIIGIVNGVATELLRKYRATDLGQ
jgi:hypothetical protein